MSSIEKKWKIELTLIIKERYQPTSNDIKIRIPAHSDTVYFDHINTPFQSGKYFTKSDKQIAPTRVATVSFFYNKGSPMTCPVGSLLETTI